MVSNGRNRVRVYFHASNTRVDIYTLINAYVTRDTGMAHDERVGLEGDVMRIEEKGKRYGARAEATPHDQNCDRTNISCTRWNLLERNCSNRVAFVRLRHRTSNFYLILSNLYSTCPVHASLPFSHKFLSISFPSLSPGLVNLTVTIVYSSLALDRPGQGPSFLGT